MASYGKSRRSKSKQLCQKATKSKSHSKSQDLMRSYRKFCYTQCVLKTEYKPRDSMIKDEMKLLSNLKSHFDILFGKSSEMPVTSLDTKQDHIKTLILSIEQNRFINLYKIGELIEEMKNTKLNMINFYIEGLKNLFLILIDRTYLDFPKCTDEFLIQEKTQFLAFIYYHAKLKGFLDSYIHYLRQILMNCKMDFIHNSIMRTFEQFMFSKSLNFSTLIDYLFEILADKNHLNTKKAMFIIAKTSQSKKFYMPQIKEKILQCMGNNNYKQYQHKFINILNTIYNSDPDKFKSLQNFSDISEIENKDDVSINSKAYALLFCSKISRKCATQEQIGELIEKIKSSKQINISIVYLKTLQEIFISKNKNITPHQYFSILIDFLYSYLCGSNLNEDELLNLLAKHSFNNEHMYEDVSNSLLNICLTHPSEFKSLKILQFLNKRFFENQTSIINTTNRLVEYNQVKQIVPWQVSLLYKHFNSSIGYSAECLALKKTYKVSSKQLNNYSFNNIMKLWNGSHKNTDIVCVENDKIHKKVKYSNSKFSNDDLCDDDIVSIQSDEFDEIIANDI